GRARPGRDLSGLSAAWVRRVRPVRRVGTVVVGGLGGLLRAAGLRGAGDAVQQPVVLGGVGEVRYDGRAVAQVGAQLVVGVGDDAGGPVDGGEAVGAVRPQVGVGHRQRAQ